MMIINPWHFYFNLFLQSLWLQQVAENSKSWMMDFILLSTVRTMCIEVPKVMTLATLKSSSHFLSLLLEGFYLRGIATFWQLKCVPSVDCSKVSQCDKFKNVHTLLLYVITHAKNYTFHPSNAREVVAYHSRTAKVFCKDNSGHIRSFRGNVLHTFF